MEDSSIASRLARRVLNAIGRGRVSTSDDSGVIQLIQAKFNDLETIDGLPRVAEFGFTSRPPDGCDILALFVGGDRSSGVIVGTNHQSSRPTGLLVGETMIYSYLGQSIYLSEGGIVIEAKSLPVTINDATTVTINCSSTMTVVAPTSIVFDTPLLKVTGDIQDNSGTNSSTMSTMRNVHDEHEHEVEGIETGTGSVTSNTPTVTE